MPFILERLNSSPPTAVLFVVERDLELGNPEGWWIECAVPQAVFDSLDADNMAQHVRNLQVGIKWVNGIVQDVHAPPSVPTIWGMRPRKYGSDPLRGHVTSIRWSLSTDPPLVSQQPTTRADEESNEAVHSEDIRQLAFVLGSAVTQLSRTCAVGFLLAVALILLGYLRLLFR